MELRDVPRALRRHWIAALVVFAVGLAVSAYAAYRSADEFRGTTVLVVEPVRGSPGNMVQYLPFSLSALRAQVETDALHQKVVRSVPGAYGRHYKLSTSVDPGTSLLRLTVQSPRRVLVARLANTYARELIDAQLLGGVFQVRVVAYAATPLKPVGRQRLVPLIAGAVLSALVAVLVAILAQALRRRGIDASKVQDEYGLRVLAEIPASGSGSPPDPARLLQHADGMAEAVVELRTNVELGLDHSGQRYVCVTSGANGEGSTTVAASLAWATAMVGKAATLVEADLRRPSSVDGFLKTLMDAGERANGLVRVPVSGPAGESRITVIPANAIEGSSGSGAYHPADVISASLPRLLRRSPAEEQLTVVDAPPIAAAETKLIVGMTGAVIVVVDASRRDALRSLGDTVRQVGEANGRILGVVLNRARPD